MLSLLCRVLRAAALLPTTSWRRCSSMTSSCTSAMALQSSACPCLPCVAWTAVQQPCSWAAAVGG